jgi:UPF0176 protein
MSSENIGERIDPKHEFTVLALYRFTRLPQQDCTQDLVALQEELERQCRAFRARGCLLIANEGINGTICSDVEEEFLLDYFQTKFEGMRYRISKSSHQIFARLKVKIKSEIVTLGQDGVDPTKGVGTYVPPEDWNEFLLDPETLVIDTRNHYEIRLGTFVGAENPHTTSFREFPAWLKQQAEEREPPKRIAMYCTGGIRCEKATVITSELFPNTEVYHLEGGILAYLDKVQPEDSLFDGECYVFDQRTAVTHGLKPSERYTSCFACRSPLGVEDLQRDDFVEGISCRYCLNELTEKRRERLEGRQRQIQLASMDGTSKPHIYDSKEGSPAQQG